MEWRWNEELDFSYYNTKNHYTEFSIPHLMQDAILPDGTRGNNRQVIDCFDENSEIYEMTSFLSINNSFITP